MMMHQVKTKKVAAKKIEKLQEVQQSSYTVEYVFPTFSHETPKMSMWHIEKTVKF